MVGAALAADPTPVPAATPPSPTCTERYPVDGPGGVDLVLGCVVTELIAYASGVAAEAGEPRRLSDFAVPIVVGLGGLLAAAIAVRQVQRVVARRLAPAAPMAWRSCPACHSLTPADRPACYRCGAPFEATATELRTDAERPVPQSFGRRFDGRPRKDEPG